MSPHRVIRPEVVWNLTGLSRSTVYRLEALGRFPRRVKVGDHASGYLLVEVEAWIQARAAARYAEATQ